MPSLLDKMYEDSKVGGKWLGKNAMGSEKKKKKKKSKKKAKKKGEIQKNPIDSK